MTTLTGSSTAVREPPLLDQTVVLIGGSSGIGLETARCARSEGAQVVLTGRDPQRLGRAAADVGAHRHAAFDALDPDRLDAFFRSLPTPVDHVMVTAGNPYYGPLADMDTADAARYVADHVRLTLDVARHVAGSVRPGGTLLLMSGTGGRRPAVGISVTALLTAGLPALTANLALELAPVRVNLIAPGFVDTPLSASLLGGSLDKRREQLRTTLPIRRVVGPEDVAALAVHVMINTALTGATFDVDGGQQVGHMTGIAVQGTTDPEEASRGRAPVLLSVNVGMPKDVSWQGRTVHTGVWKHPVTGPQMVRRLNIDGDGQGDRTGHGGEQRAVFVYQIDSYHHWERHFGRDDFTYGQFGENLTVDGLPDAEVCIGDRYRIGEAEFEVTQPRVTCYRVGLRMGEPELPALLVGHHRPGFYMRVVTEGHIQAGDRVVKTRTGPYELSVADTDALLYLPGRDPAKLRTATRIPALSPGWQESFRDSWPPRTPARAIPAPGPQGFCRRGPDSGHFA